MNSENDNNFLKRYKTELGVTAAGLLIGWVGSTYYLNYNRPENLALNIIDEVSQNKEALAHEADDMEQELDQRIKHVNQTVNQHQKDVQDSISKGRQENKQRSKEFQDNYDRTFNRILHGEKGTTDNKTQETREN